MRKYTQKGLRELVKIGSAKDITDYDFSQMKNFLQSHSLDKVGYSSGVYGLNGGLLQDTKTGTLYAITARNMALSMAF